MSERREISSACLSFSLSFDSRSLFADYYHYFFVFLTFLSEPHLCFVNKKSFVFVWKSEPAFFASSFLHFYCQQMLKTYSMKKKALNRRKIWFQRKRWRWRLNGLIYSLTLHTHSSFSNFNGEQKRKYQRNFFSVHISCFVCVWVWNEMNEAKKKV